MVRNPTSDIQGLALLVVGILCGMAPVSGKDKDADARFWLENMVYDHRFSDEEVAAVLEVEVGEVPALLEKHGIDRQKPSVKPPSKTVKVLPYPGGRHPRIGFLDGAIDPHRDSKASIFLPWKDAGYVVVDLPEALWWKREEMRELLYLAHTHIPTHWSKKNVKLDRLDWKREKSGELRSRRVLPNGIEFAARVVPREKWVDMELRLKNGSKESISGLRTQICVLLKGAPDFAEQTDANKKKVGEVVATRSRDGKRWIATVWDRARPWDNPPCPCIHSDPIFPDLEVGKEAVVRGRLFFFEGDSLEAEIDRRKKTGTLNWQAREKE